jgi:hypothetical protein
MAAEPDPAQQTRIPLGDSETVSGLLLVPPKKRCQVATGHPQRRERGDAASAGTSGRQRNPLWLDALAECLRLLREGDTRW